jgi:hypothetical protein
MFKAHSMRGRDFQFNQQVISIDSGIEPTVAMVVGIVRSRASCVSRDVHPSCEGKRASNH